MFCKIFFLQGRLAALGLQFVYCNPGHSPKIGWKKDFRKPKKMRKWLVLKVEMPSTELYLRALGPALDKGQLISE